MIEIMDNVYFTLEFFYGAAFFYYGISGLNIVSPFIKEYGSVIGILVLLVSSLFIQKGTKNMFGAFNRLTEKPLKNE